MASQQEAPVGEELKQPEGVPVQTISTPAAPAAIGPYVQATAFGNLLFTAGQIPLVPGTMDLVTGPIEAQTTQVLRNLAAVLEAAGSDWSRVLKTTVFLTDLADFAAFNAVYEQLLGGAKPARSTVQVAALPRGAKVEIELIAALPHA
jgi:2-iminobutanoate/2-iminopropanoate deaminase